MTKRLPLLLLTALLLVSPLAEQHVFAQDREACVILLHGLARTDKAMEKLAERLSVDGFLVVNVDYPSRDYPISTLSPMVFSEAMAACGEAPTLHVVTHSLGGILTRYFLANYSLPGLGRVVMLAPPNQGSEIVDKLESVPGLSLAMGPAILELGTDEDDLPRMLGPVNFDLGVIAGDRSIDPVLSQLLPEPNDGKVSVGSTRVDGMCAWVVMHVTHALMMRNDEVIDQVLHYLHRGYFDAEGAENGLCDHAWQAPEPQVSQWGVGLGEG